MLKRSHAVVMLAGGLAALAASTLPGTAGETPVHLNVGVIKIAGLSDIYAAQKLGYFAEQGLDVSVTTANNGQDLLAAQQAKKLDIVLAIPGTAMQAREKGYNVVLVMQNEVAHAKPPDQGAVMVRADSPITSMKQLAGKKIAYGQLDNQQWAGIHVALRKAGVDPKSTQEVEIPFPQMPGVLQQGLVDAVGALEPFVSAMLKSKQARVISWNYVESVPAQPNGAFWATEEWAKQNPATITKFQSAVHKAITTLNGSMTLRKRMIVEFTGMKPEMVESIIPDVWTDRVVRSDWEKTMKLMSDAGLIKPSMRFDDLVPPSAMHPR